MKTKKSGIVEELKEKHKKRLARAQQELKRRMAKPGKRFDRHYYTSDILLFYKWAYRVGKGWYGFALGNVPRCLEGRAGRISILAGNSVSGF